MAPGKRFLTAFPAVTTSATPIATPNPFSSPHSASSTPFPTVAFPPGFGQPPPMVMVNQWGFLSTASPVNSPRKVTSISRKAASPRKTESPRKGPDAVSLPTTANPTPMPQGDQKPRDSLELPTPESESMERSAVSYRGKLGVVLFDTFGNPVAPVAGYQLQSPSTETEGEA